MPPHEDPQERETTSRPWSSIPPAASSRLPNGCWCTQATRVRALWDDLVATVTALVAQGQQQADALARLTEEQPIREEGANKTGPAGKPLPQQARRRAPRGRLRRSSSRWRATPTSSNWPRSTWVHDLLLPGLRAGGHLQQPVVPAVGPSSRGRRAAPRPVAGLAAVHRRRSRPGRTLRRRDHLDPALLQLRAAEGAFGACTASPAHHRLLASPAPASEGEVA